MRRKQNPTGNPFGTIKLKRATVFTAKPRVFVSLSEHILERKRLKVVDATAHGFAAPVAMPEKAWDVRLRRLDDCGGGFLAFSQQCHLAVLESLDVLSSQKPKECLGFFQYFSVFALFDFGWFCFLLIEKPFNLALFSLPRLLFRNTK